MMPTAHGSGLFQRGETQVLNVTTLGMPRMDQLLDTIGIDDKKRYMHHYNMPPYANGETGRVGSPKRREIGHGLLAERALLPVVPPVEEFPYALRLVSEVLASNGSTSMASVCASSLSLMDAGVPIKAPVAGIAMGLVKVDDTYITLTDILGAEDAFGDMDFKVAGTAEFVTALQLDTKIDGLPADVLAAALRQARDARLKILEVMAEAIAEPRADVRDTAPKIVSLEIPIDKIGEVIGPKGKVINALQQETGADIAVDDDGVVGTVTIGAKDGGAVAEARRRIELILDPPKAEVGADLHRARSSTSPSSARSSTSSPAATAWSTSPSSAGASGSSGSRTSSISATRSRSGSTTSTRRARCRCRWSATTDADGSGGDAVRLRPAAQRRRPAPSRPAAERPAPDVVSFEDTWEAEAAGHLRRPRARPRPAAAGRGGDDADRGPRRNPRRRRP